MVWTARSDKNFVVEEVEEWNWVGTVWLVCHCSWGGSVRAGGGGGVLEVGLEKLVIEVEEGKQIGSGLLR